MKLYDINNDHQLALVADDYYLNVRYVNAFEVMDMPLEENKRGILKQMHHIANNPRPTGLTAPASNPMVTGWKYFDKNEKEKF